MKSFGKVLINKGNCRFEPRNTEGVQIKGEARRMLPIQIGKQRAFVLGLNNDKVRVLKVE